MQKIDTSTWKEFSLSTLFNASNGDVDLQQKDINNKGYFVISSGEQNNGVIGKTDVKAKVFAKNTITIDMFGNVFYRDFDYKMVTHARVFSLSPKFKMTEKIGLFIVSCLSSLKQLYSYSNMCNWAKIQDMKILLPSKEIDVPDFEYMEQYISELEQERISELEQYLLVTGLNDYELTEDEKEIYNKDIILKNFNIDNVFEKIKTKRLPYTANELKEKHDNIYCLPALTAGIENQGLSCYVPKKDATVLKNVVSVSANGANTGAMFYQPNEFTVLQDGYAIKYKDENIELTKNMYLYLITCMQKVIKGNYNWSKKAGWERIRKSEISLPIKLDENNNPLIDRNSTYHKDGYIPDFTYMEKYIRVQEKLAIKDVVLLKDSIIAKTKTIVNDN